MEPGQRPLFRTHTVKIQKTFHWDDGSDNEFGTEGWNIEPNTDGIVPVLGFGVSHDVLDHGIGSDGMTGMHEFGALGAYLFRMHRIHGSDMVEIFLCGEYYDGPTILDSVPLEDDLEDEIKSAMRYVIAEAKENNLSCDVDFSRQFFKLAAPLIRMGYRRAEKAFSGDSNVAQDMAQRIRKSVEDYGIREIGDKLIVSVDTETESVEVFVESVYDTVE